MEGVNWRKLWAMTTGHDLEFVDPYVASLIFYTLTICTGIILRSLSAAFIPNPLKGLALDSISTMESSAYFFEHNFVLENYGSMWFGIAIVIQCFLCIRTFGDTIDNPVKALPQLADREITFLWAVVKVVVQFFAGLSSYHFARLVWSLELTSDHQMRFHETSCDSDLQVAVLFGCILELCACLSDTWLGMQTLSTSVVLDDLLKCINGATMIVLGVTTTGMYFNPSMASGHMLGCIGTSASEHFFVYWIGPFIGCFIALKLNEIFHIDVTKQKAS